MFSDYNNDGALLASPASSSNTSAHSSYYSSSEQLPHHMSIGIGIGSAPRLSWSQRIWNLLVQQKKYVAFLIVFIALAFVIGLIIYVAKGKIDQQDNTPDDTYPHTVPISTGKLFTFNDQYNRQLGFSYTTLDWSPYDHTYITTDKQGNIQQTDAKTGNTQILITVIDAPILSNTSFYTYTSDYRYFLFANNWKALYRHSGTATYTLYDRTKKTSTTLNAGLPLQATLFSPSLTDPAIAYVYLNNVYLFNITSGQTTGVTSDGVINSIINGVCDWAYEEEIYGVSAVMWFNSLGTYLSYLRFDESMVPEYSFTQYNFTLNVPYRYKYPLVGQTNSIVSVGIYNVYNASNTLLDVGGSTTEQYVTNVVWLTDSTLGIKIMPRSQQSSVLHSVNVTVPLPFTQLSNQSHPFYLDSDFVLQSLGVSQQNGYIDTIIVDDHNHIGLWASDGTFNGYLTRSATWQVTQVYCYHPPSSTLFFSSTYLSSRDRTLHSVNVNTLVVTMLVPQVSPAYQVVSFSGDCSYFTVSDQAARFDSRLYAVNVSDSSAPPSLVQTLSDNTAVLNVLNTYALPTQHFTTFSSATATSQNLNAWFLLPPTIVGDLEIQDCSTQYPLLINVYGGPGPQLADNRYARGNNAGAGYANYLSSSLGFVYLTFDPIGTSGISDSFSKNYTTLYMGIQEEADIMDVINNQLTQYCFIDRTRIAYRGWSYGGMMATRVATSRLPGAVSRVVAGAPVTDWRLYDSIYTERYMQTTNNNLLGYTQTSLITDRASHLTVPNFLLIHGTADDNVHWQNSALLMQALVYYQQQFNQFHYTNRQHGLALFNGFGNLGPPLAPNQAHMLKMVTAYLADMVALPGININQVNQQKAALLHKEQTEGSTQYQQFAADVTPSLYAWFDQQQLY